MSSNERGCFWTEAFALQGSVSPQIALQVLIFGLFAAFVWGMDYVVETYWNGYIHLEVAPFEIAGAALGLLLILRTNAGYDRWWEARKIWGGIVNQSRNLVIDGLAFGPEDARWRDEWVRWSAVFSHVARSSLRAEKPCPAVVRLLGQQETDRIADSEHMPSYVALQLARLLREATDDFDMDRYSFLQIDKERAQLIDHIGACERILKTPLPVAYSIKIRRFIALFLITLPFALLHQMTAEWMVPVVTMMVAYPLLSLDQIGVELENPFSRDRLNPLPLDSIATTIEGNAMGILEADLRETDPTDEVVT